MMTDYNEYEDFDIKGPNRGRKKRPMKLSGRGLIETKGIIDRKEAKLRQGGRSAKRQERAEAETF